MSVVKLLPTSIQAQALTIYNKDGQTLQSLASMSLKALATVLE